MRAQFARAAFLWLPYAFLQDDALRIQVVDVQWFDTHFRVPA